jgi:hypothetical protein
VTQLNSFVASHLGAVGLVIGIGCVILLLIIGMLFVQSRRIALLSERLDALTQGVEGQNLEAVLDTHLQTVVRVAGDLDEVINRTAVLEASSRLHFARLGLVRFNPFDDTGGNQSFALAMLDSNNDGFVATSLHSRTGTRLYAKAVFGGEAESALGAEEAQAVEIAVSQGSGQVLAVPAGPPQGRRTGARGSGRTTNTGAPSLPKEAVAPRAASAPKEPPAEKAPAAPRESAASRTRPARSGAGGAPAEVAAAANAAEPEGAPIDEGQATPSA